MYEPPGTPYPSAEPMDLPAWLAARGLPHLERPRGPVFEVFRDCQGWRLTSPWRAYPVNTVLLTRRIDGPLARFSSVLVAVEESD